MMRVAYVCADSGIPVWGSKGASAHVRAVIRALRRCGHDVTLFTPRPEGQPPPDLADIAVVDLPATGSAPVVARELSAMATDDILLAALHERGPFDLVYERYSLWSAAGMTYAHDHPATTSVLEVNAPLIDEQARHRTLHHRDAAERTARMALGLADGVVAVSEPVAAWARAFGAKTVAVLPNGADVDRFTDAAGDPRSSGPGDRFTIVFSGSLKPWHGVDILLTAVALLVADESPAHTRLLIVGDGPERATVETLLDRLALRGMTTLTGAVDPDEVPRWLLQADVGAAPYPAGAGSYFSPLKVVEYMAAGLAVAASAVGQVPSLLDHGRAGLLIPPGDTEALARALRTLRDEVDLRTRLGAHGRGLARSRHSWNAIVAEALELVGSTRPCGDGADDSP